MKTKFFTIAGFCYVACALIMAANSPFTPINRGGVGSGSQDTVAQENRGGDGYSERLSGLTRSPAPEKPANRVWHGWLPTQARIARAQGCETDTTIVQEDRAKNFQPNCLIFWTAKWCSSCKKMYPVVEKLQEEGYVVYILDYDENRDFGRTMGVRSLPTFIIWEAKKEVTRHIGLVSAEEIKKSLKKNTKPNYDIW